LNDFGRMIMCGMISEYNDQTPRPGPSLGAVVRKRLKIQGFIVSDQRHRQAEFRAMAAPLVKSGQLKYREDIVDGLDRAPEAFIGLLQAAANCWSASATTRPGEKGRSQSCGATTRATSGVTSPLSNG